jgi:type 1 glutamine amidotransferase
MTTIKTITAIVGDYFHEEGMIRDSFEAALQKSHLQGEIQIQYAAYDQILDRLREKPDAIVFYKEDRLNPRDPEVVRWMTPEIAKEIVSYVEQGGAWLGWHAGLASYEKVDEYVSLLRGHFTYHPKEHSEVTYTGVENGLGIPVAMEFTLLDEHYFVECDEANTNVFLRSSSRDGDSIAGWYHDYGKGKVCCFTPAHTKDALLDDHLLHIMGTLIKWTVS